MRPYERKLLVALAALFLLLVSAVSYLHFKQEVHLKVVSAEKQ